MNRVRHPDPAPDSFDALHWVIVLLVRSRIDQVRAIGGIRIEAELLPVHDHATSVLARINGAIETVEDVLELTLPERADLERTIAKRYEDGLDP